MSQLDQYVNDQADDWTDGDSGLIDDANELQVRKLHDVVSVDDNGFCLIDTSSIPDDATVDSATFYWYDHGYLQPKNSGYSRQIWIYDNVSAYTIIYDDNSIVTVGASSHALEAGELSDINLTGDTDFRFTVAEQINKDRTWQIRAHDGYSGSNEQPRLVVNYTEAGAAGRSKTMILR